MAADQLEDWSMVCFAEVAAGADAQTSRNADSCPGQRESRHHRPLLMQRRHQPVS
ncbi:hypothetical protein M2284_002834 [Rhodococcus sp. LBL1]|nr:hypothetical protein [Rhodococcus sp. LBL1]MDH6684501.1 hypothetical protein [Rhodococcus sp. LBL2]